MRRGRQPRRSNDERRPLKLLGAIIAGGQATRFGSDKAYARYLGKRLIDLVGSALAAQCDALVICGRDEDGFDCLQDQPEAGLGPLGGLNAALQHASTAGYDAVLSAGCDIPNLPPDLAEILDGEGAAIVQSQPVVGFWPAQLAPRLDLYLRDGGRSLYGFAEHVGAREVTLDPPLMNINQPKDLD